jgi:hypothetical protein
MEKLPTKLASTLDATTNRFQVEIISRLKLFDLSKTAILHYSEFQENELHGYSFDNLQSRFKLVGFKEGSKIKSIEYKDIVKVGKSYISGELSDSFFVLNMATFEHWLLWVLRTYMLSNPRDIYPKNNKQIDVTYLRKFPNMSMLWEELVDDYLRTLPYQGMKALMKTFLNYFGLKESDFTKDLLGLINENSLCRNIIIHNQKKVNATYVKKSGKFAKYAVGDIVAISEDVLIEQADNLLRFMGDFRNNNSGDGKPE